MRLNTEQLKSRLAFDYRIMSSTNWNGLLNFAAFSNGRDALAATTAPLGPPLASQARHYLIQFNLKTLEGPDRYCDKTLVHVDLLANGSYPYTAPGCMVISRPVPWSPHFKEGFPICIGEIWQQRRGTMLLAELCVHILKLLNFDEISRGGAYTGWNAAATRYWEKRGCRPIDPTIRYPVLPVDLTHPAAKSRPLFVVKGNDNIFRVREVGR